MLEGLEIDGDFLSERLEEGKGGVTIVELALHEILKLDHQLIVQIEKLETAQPVLKGDECLLVWIDLSKHLLQQLLCDRSSRDYAR